MLLQKVCYKYMCGSFSEMGILCLHCGFSFRPALGTWSGQLAP